MRNAETAAFLAALLTSAGSAARADGFAVVGVRVFPGTSATALHDDWTVIVRDGLVAAVGPRATVEVGDDLRVVDGRGRTVLPGWFDLHVHLFGSAGRFDRPVDVDPALNAEAAAAFGVTTQLDLNAPEEGLLARFGPGRAARPGAPRVLFAGAAISAAGGHGTEGGFPGRTAADADEARRQVRALVGRGVHVVKLVVDGGGWADVPRVPVLGDAAVRAAVEAAHAAGRKVLVHAVEVEHARAAVQAGADALAHLPLVGPLDDAFVDLLVRRGTAVVPTLAVYEAQFALIDDPGRLDSPDVRRFVPAAVREGFLDGEWRAREAATRRPEWFRRRWPDALDRLRSLHEAGVTLLPGTDAGIPGAFHGDALHRELEAWVEAGVSPGAALHAATLRAARFLGLDDRLGTIEPGREADLVLVDGDPTADVEAARRVVMVAVRGLRVDRETLVRRVAGAAAVPAARSLGLADFEEGAPAGLEVRRSMHADEGEARARRVEDGAAENPTRYLRVEGDVRFRPPSGGFAGVRIPVPEAAAAASGAYVGVRFRARAATRRTLRLLVATDAVADGDQHGAKFVVGPEWHAYHVPFESLNQVGHGRRVRFDPARVTAIEVLTEAGDDGPFRFDVDDLELYR